MPSASLVKEFENLIGKENVFTSEADRQSYAYDAAVLPSVVPGLVLRPTSTEQLGALIERCYANGLPMTIRGAGTNLSGGTVPDADKSVVILTQGLNKIIEINEEDLFAIVEPGVCDGPVRRRRGFQGPLLSPDPVLRPSPPSAATLRKTPAACAPEIRRHQRLRHGPRIL